MPGCPVPQTCLLSPSSRIKILDAWCHSCFYMVLGIGTQIFIRSQRAVYPLSQLSSPQIRSIWKRLTICVLSTNRAFTILFSKQYRIVTVDIKSGIMSRTQDVHSFYTNTNCPYKEFEHLWIWEFLGWECPGTQS